VNRLLQYKPGAVSCSPLRLLILLPLMALACGAARGQHIDSISQAKTLCIESFGGGPDAALLRDSLVRRLEKSRRFRIVQSPAEADAVVTGTGVIWIRGFIAVNPRTPNNDREAVYGGYLSVEAAAGGQPLWSWLATPGKLVWSNVVDDLAGRAAKKLLEASEKAKSSAPAAAPAPALAQTSLTAAGATFPAPLYEKWFEDFEALHPGVRLRYSAIGSQLGIERLVAGSIDFAGSDAPPEVITGAAATAHLRRIASVLGGVVPIYNLKGVTQDLRFAPQTLADIYLGRVKRWNDAEIRQDNKGVNLPDAEIEVVHRSDGSGTSWVWSDFLSKVSPAWAATVGRGTTLHWPVGTGAVHNEGVAETVRKTLNSIGYVELTYAVQNELSYGSVRNRAGEFIHADLDSLSEAAKVSFTRGEPPPGISDAPGKYAYPISAFTWLVIPDRTADPARRAAIAELLRWVLTSGQKECAALGYVPLPREVVENQLRILDTLP